MTRLFEIGVWWLFYSEMLPGDCPAARIFAIKHEKDGDFKMHGPLFYTYFTMKMRAAGQSPSQISL